MIHIYYIHTHSYNTINRICRFYLNFLQVADCFFFFNFSMEIHNAFNDSPFVIKLYAHILTQFNAHTKRQTFYVKRIKTLCFFFQSHFHFIRTTTACQPIYMRFMDKQHMAVIMRQNKNAHHRTSTYSHALEQFYQPYDFKVFIVNFSVYP